MLRTLAKSYQDLIDYFVPASLKDDREATNQARMFLISHTFGPVLGNTVPLALFVFDPTPGWDILVLALSITSFWVFPFLLRAGARYDSLVITSVINLNFCILWSCYFNGGVTSPTLPWLLIIPILSLFYIGGAKRLQVHLLSLFGISFVLFLGLYNLIDPPINDIPDVALQALGVVSTSAALAYVATMAIYYARIFDAGVELENEVQRRRKAMHELREAVATADRAGLMKAEFLARMSHELRTPLNAVIGYSQILKEDAYDIGGAQMDEDVDRIHDAGQYLLRLINMILDLSKIEAGRMQFDMKTLTVTDLIQSAIDGARDTIDSNHNTLSLEIDPNVAEIETDGARMVQIMDAILQNAAIYTEGGDIEIHCSLAANAAGQDEYTILIRDTGCGIAPERMTNLFETLVDSRDASTSKYGGTGMNLTVTKRLCEAMGGGIDVESTLGEGSCFTIRMPRKDTTQTVKPAASPIELADEAVAA
ncbi:HAMP domain-containing sensor histidine kinase [uncultured Hoeflea sp.]|uniref:sensor histidine kinase n=1 Tax=uncultured Hoeflea sp. TaxID=538666 RepID=UPI0026295013|nr:HAMP domain-containing sensor histidine kinase [uncultured Hoeflea sp.]